MSEDFERRKNLKIPIDKILVSKDNPRQSFDEEGLRRLGESIKSHGQLQPIVVRKKGSLYELVVGERRFRACALVGINEVEAEVRDIDDAGAMELRLIENTQREDLSDAEKGDAVLALWANYDKYETIKDIAQSINTGYSTALSWVRVANKLSEKVRNLEQSSALPEDAVRWLVKYPHSIQEKLANAIIQYNIRGKSGHLHRDFLKLYDANPQRDLNEVADEVLGIETVTVPKSELPKETLEKFEEKKQLAKVQRIHSKPSKPITKEQVKEKLAEKKTDFKFVRARVSHGKARLSPPLKTEIKPTIIPNPQTPDYSLCKCAVCPLFMKHCSGRCWK